MEKIIANLNEIENKIKELCESKGVDFNSIETLTKTDKKTIVNHKK